MKILIVDDRRDNNYLLQSLLQGKGYETATAPNGAKALELLTSGNFHLIISDILMPVMDGFQLCRTIRKDPRWRDIPFIIYTATYTGPKDEELALKMGADRFVIKPCEPEALLNIISEVLEERNNRKPADNKETHDEEEILKLYSERLVKKLEQKMEQLEQELAARKAAEQARRESEEKYQSLFNQSVEGIYLHDLQGRIIDVNRMACLQSGYSREELLEMTVFDFLPVESAKNMPRDEILLLWNQWQPGESLTLEVEHQRKDGSVYPVEVTTGVVRIGEQNLMMAIGKEITERKQAEEQLRAQYSLLQIAGETARFGGWSVDLKDYSCTWSDAVADIHEMPHGYAPQVKDGISFYAPEWRDRITRVFTDCAEKGIPYDDEMEIITRTGKRIWVRAIGRAVKDEKGRIIRVEGSFQDISDSKQKQQALLENEDRLSKIMLAANDGTWDWNLTSNKVYFDPCYYMMAGYEVDEFPHQLEEFQKRVHPEDVDYVMSQAEKHLKGEIDRFQVEFRFRMKSGDWLWIAGRGIIAERDEQGRPLRFVGTHQDISERKRTEQELLELKLDLEIQVAEKTRELQERLQELERFHDATIERELRMKELRDEIARLKGEKR